MMISNLHYNLMQLLLTLIVWSGGIWQVHAATATNSDDQLLMKRQYTFAVVPKRMNSPYWESVQRGCETRARVISQAPGSTVNVTCLFIGPAEGGPETEVNQLEILYDLLLEEQNYYPKIDGLALAVVEEPSATKIIAEYTAAGIPTFTFDSDAVDSQRLGYIGTNNWEMGSELGRVVLQVVDDTTASSSTSHKRSFAIVGAGSPNIKDRMDGTRQILVNAGWMEVSGSWKDCEGDNALAVQQMHELVEQHPDLTAIIPVGAWPMDEPEMWMEFVDLHPGIVTVVGDALQGQIDLMNMGYANALVGQLPFEMGKLAIDKLLEVKQAEEQGLPIPFPMGKIFETNFLNVINIPQDLPSLVQDMNYIGSWRIFGYVLAGIVVLMSVGFAMWTLWYRNTRIVRASQPVFLHMVCAGTLIMASTVIPLSVDDEHTSQHGCDVACMASPWLFSIGFVVSCSALFSKTWRVNKVFRHPQAFQRIKVTEKDVLTPFGALFAANVIVLLSWTLINPLRFERKAHSGTDNWNRVYKSFYGTCVSSNGSKGGSSVFVVLLIIINLIALIIAAVQAYQARYIHVEFSESQYIAFAILCTMQAFLVGSPILLLMTENPVPTYIVQSILIFFTCSSILLFIFVPKIVRAKEIQRQTQISRSKSSFSRSKSRLSRLGNEEGQSGSQQLNVPAEENSDDQLRFQVISVVEPVKASIEKSLSLRDSSFRVNDLVNECGTVTTANPLDGSGDTQNSSFDRISYLERSQPPLGSWDVEAIDQRMSRINESIESSEHERSVRNGTTSSNSGVSGQSLQQVSSLSSEMESASDTDVSTNVTSGDL